MATKSPANAPARDPELEAKLRGQLRGQAPKLPPKVFAFQRVSSTMDVAHRLAAEGAEDGTLIWTERQEQGRGRLGRTWESPAGGIYCSLVVRPTRSATETPQLALVAGLSVAEAIREVTALSPQLRWPNDLLIDGKKLAGILVEQKSGAVVIGIGVNVTTNPRDLPETATSLAACGATACDRVQLGGALYRRFQAWYDVWATNGFSPIREALRPWIGIFGQLVHLTAGSEELEGTATDLDEAGRLLVRLDSGLVRAFEVGEVALLR